MRNQVITLCAVTLLGGCANVRPMAINSKTTALDLSKESVVLISVRVHQDDRDSSDFRPERLAIARFENGQNPNAMLYKLDDGDAAIKIKDDEMVYPFRIRLEPGHYIVTSLSGTYSRGIVLTSLLHDLEVPAGRVVYGGRLDVSTHPRTDAGTVTISVINASPQEIPVLTNQYPILKDSDIVTSLLVPHFPVGTK